MKWVRQAQILLGRAGFNPESVVTMSEAELLSHITHIAPPGANSQNHGTADGSGKTYVNEARLRRKNQSSQPS